MRTEEFAACPLFVYAFENPAARATVFIAYVCHVYYFWHFKIPLKKIGYPWTTSPTFSPLQVEQSLEMRDFREKHIRTPKPLPSARGV
jgi:hypothetical protein